MAAATLLFAASSVFVACSDDDDSMMGPVGINSIVTTTSSASVYWTNVDANNCDGYKVILHEGGRDGAVVEEVTTSSAKETNHNFTNLKANTVYTVSTQGIPAQGSGFSSADIAYRQFMTAPLVTTASVSMGSRINKEVDENGEIVEVLRAFARVFVNQVAPTVFDNVTISNCGSYFITVYEGTEDKVGNDTKVKDITLTLKNVADGAEFFPLKLNTTYTVATRAVSDGASCWYTGNATASYYTFTTPAN